MSWSGYIPGSLLNKPRVFLRDGSIPIHRSVEGDGIAPGIEDYPFQGLDLATEPYLWPWLANAKMVAYAAQTMGEPIPANGHAGYLKRRGLAEVTPLGTPVAELTRKGHDLLAAPCGNCQLNIAKCRCGQGSAGDEDSWT